MSQPLSSPVSGHDSSPKSQTASEDRLSVPSSLRNLAPRKRGLVDEQLHRTLALIAHVGQMARMTLGTVRALFRRPLETRAILQQIDTLGVASIGIVVVTSVFIGMVMAVQFAFGLRKFGGMEYTGRVIGLDLFARART